LLPADRHLRPGQLLLRQRFEERHRAAAAGHHQGGPTTTGDCLTQRIGYAHCHRLSHLPGVVMGAGLHALRQFQFRDRHTSSCHPG
jgi:hypothetical protein